MLILRENILLQCHLNFKLFSSRKIPSFFEQVRRRNGQPMSLRFENESFVTVPSLSQRVPVL
jgi:hypothetical protein